MYGARGEKQWVTRQRRECPRSEPGTRCGAITECPGRDPPRLTCAGLGIWGAVIVGEVGNDLDCIAEADTAKQIDACD
jgi:hypothetical protein